MKDWYVFHPFSGKASGLRLLVASVGVIAMHLLSCSYAIADGLPFIEVEGLELTADQVTREVLEGNPAEFQMTVQNISGYRVLLGITTCTFWYVDGDSGDKMSQPTLSYNPVTEEYDGLTNVILDANVTVNYGITALTTDDGNPWNDGSGHWKISTNVSGFAVDPDGNLSLDPLTEVPIFVKTKNDVLLDVIVNDPTPEPTPEPGTCVLMGIGGLFVAFWLKKSGTLSAFTA